MTRNIVKDAILAHPQTIYNINPHTLMESGHIIGCAKQMNAHACDTWMRTPVEKNLYALYSTILYTCTRFRLGDPLSDVSKMMAFKMSHDFIMLKFEKDHRKMCFALSHIHGTLHNQQQQQYKK